MCTCVLMYVCCMSVCEPICVKMWYGVYVFHTCMYKCMSVWIHACTWLFVRMNVCLGVSVYGYICVWMCVFRCLWCGVSV